MTRDDTLLSVENLQTQFHTEEGIVRAVDGVSFDIAEGEIVGLVGESGAGKSVATSSLLRLVESPGQIVGGEVTFKGETLIGFEDEPGPDGDPVPRDDMLSDEAMRDRIDVRELYDLLSRPAIAFTLLIAMLGTYVVQGLLSFLPTFLIEFRAYSAALAGTAFSAFFVVRTVGQIALGRVSDSYGRDYAIAGSMLAGGAGVALLMEARTLPTVGAAVLLVGLGTSFFSAIDPRFLDNLAAEERGTGFGLVRTGYTVVGSTGSLGLGILADSLGWYDAFGVLAALFLLSFLLLAANAVVGGRY